jgi:hypothetical protein
MEDRSKQLVVWKTMVFASSAETSKRRPPLLEIVGGLWRSISLNRGDLSGQPRQVESSGSQKAESIRPQVSGKKSETPIVLKKVWKHIEAQGRSQRKDGSGPSCIVNAGAQ